MADIAPWVASISTWIVRRATDYATTVDRADQGERALLEIFDVHVQAVLAEYDPPNGRRYAGDLVFVHLYAAARQPIADEQGWRVPSAVFAALLAAEAEFRGPLRLSARQNTLLAEEYERLGRQLSGLAMPSHAVLAYRRAAALYRIIDDVDAEDRCGLHVARARTRAISPRWRRLTGYFSDILCGYGYRPFRMLGWVVVQLVVFTVLALLFAGDPHWTETIYMCATSFLNPLGPGDTSNLRAAARPLFVVESWAGTVSMSVFFALLVRKWFRL
ncbi:hypothetical protein [Nocardia alni]|uniref:hypothetical protein n=1 Tax=Nocardia alni TaxID=2815723 RepID=UPI001C22EB05|nr:hypothetical protein [Nocardia alni]